MHNRSSFFLLQTYPPTFLYVLDLHTGFDSQHATLGPTNILQELGHHHTYPQVVTIHDVVNILKHGPRQHLRVKKHLKVHSVHDKSCSDHYGVAIVFNSFSVILILVRPVRQKEVSTTFKAHNPVSELLLGIDERV